MDIEDPNNTIISRESKFVNPNGPVMFTYNTSVRHGFGEISQDQIPQLISGYYSYFADKRHDTQGRPQEEDSLSGGDWRVTDRQRTVNAALVLCLNLGVDPPDVIKTQPAARMETWVDPQLYVDSKKALEQIGKNLQSQYESLGTRTKYKQSLDPNIDDIKRFCVGLRRSARDDRILFHYNGHGVPKPTLSGEIWVFNRGYTQYIPLSIFELQYWLGAPVIYCYDCSGAGNIIKSFNDFVKKRKQTPALEDEIQYPYETCIQLGACQGDEILPMNPDLPADLFTCCITTPVDMAVRWFLLQNSNFVTSSRLNPADIKIPGKITDRRTPLGELNWIFTAITDTIAWSALKPALFKRLFRQDLIVAAMFRNFLLACRIMKAHNCHPVSSPAMPDTSDHPLWDSWDATVNHCLLQVMTGSPTTDVCLFSDFFEQQLTAFEMWLIYQSSDVTKPPEQLSILLQVLLSQIHRLRALTLLCRYLDLGPYAVRIALNMGFFIYVLKLLQSPAPELRPVLVFIWARIMAVDRSVQTELVKENGFMYFVNILIDSNPRINRTATTSDPAICCFVLAQFAHGFPTAVKLLGAIEPLIQRLESFLDSESPLLRLWSIFLLSEICPKKSLTLVLWRLLDPIPEVRVATLRAAASYINSPQISDIDTIGYAMIAVTLDGSSIVRYELIVTVNAFIMKCEQKFLVCAFTTLEEEYSASRRDGDLRSKSPAHGTVCLALWRLILVLTTDALPHIRNAAQEIVDRIQSKLLNSPMGKQSLLMARELQGKDTNIVEQASLLGTHPIAAPPWLQKKTDKHKDNNDSGHYAWYGFYRTDSLSPTTSVTTPPGSPPIRRNSRPELRLLEQGNSVDTRTSMNSSYENAAHANSNDSNDNNNANSQIGSNNDTLVAAQTQENNGTNNNIPMSTAQQALIKAQTSDSNQSETPVGSLIRSAMKWFIKDDLSSEAMNSKLALMNKKNQVSLTPQAPIPTVSAPSVNPPVQSVQSGQSVESNGTVSTPKANDTLVSSTFREYCVEFFREPQLEPSESEEPGSKEYNERQWRKARNERTIAETQVQKGLALTGAWGNHVSTVVGIGDPPQRLLFSQYGKHLLATDSNNVAVFDWHRGELLNRFLGGADIADLKFLNEDDQPLVLTASKDGSARVFRNYEEPSSIRIVTSWFLFADLVHQKPQRPNVVLDWEQSKGHLLVGGDARVIRVWDAAREQAIYDMPVRTSSELCSLSSDQVSGNIVAAGYNDGAVHVYDKRLDKKNGLIRRWKPIPQNGNYHRLGHSTKIVNVKMQRGGPRELVSGSTDGQVCLWDIRMAAPVIGFKAHTKDMRCLDVHEHAPVIATAARVTGIWSTSGHRVPTLKGMSSSYLSSKVSPAEALSFHPHSMVLAVSNVDGPAICIYKCST